MTWYTWNTPSCGSDSKAAMHHPTNVIFQTCNMNYSIFQVCCLNTTRVGLSASSGCCKVSKVNCPAFIRDCLQKAFLTLHYYSKSIIYYDYPFILMSGYRYSCYKTALKINADKSILEKYTLLISNLCTMSVI